MDLRSGLPTLQMFTDGEIDFNLLPPRLRPTSLEQSTNPVWRNIILTFLRAQELALNGITPEFQPIAGDKPAVVVCDLCKGTRTLISGYNERFPVYMDCPDCTKADAAAKAAELRQSINTAWNIPITTFPEFLNRPDAPRAATARDLQQQLLQQIPSAISLLLHGPTGTGKSRLLAEIAVESRKAGKSAIYKNLEPLRQILYDFSGETDMERQKARTRRELAWQHLLHADVVVIDEYDHAEGTAIHERILEMLNWRYDHGLTTVIGANTLKGMLEPVISRLKAKGNLSLSLEGDSDARRFFGHFGFTAVGGD